MTEPTMSSMTTYGSMDVSSVRVHGPITQDNHATTKLYVDQAAASVRDGIVNGAGPLLDTLKEIESYLVGEPSVSGGLISQISSVQSQLDGEIARSLSVDQNVYDLLQEERDTRILAVADVSSRLDAEVVERVANVTDFNIKANYLEERVNTLSGQHAGQEQRHDDEYKRATAAEAALSASLASSVVEVNARTDDLLGYKLDKTGGAVSGDLNIVGGLLYIGSNWRIQAVGQSLEFQFSPDQETWSTGIPFISV